jgi:steroid delta-isomerase-like uncharacterized protein
MRDEAREAVRSLVGDYLGALSRHDVEAVVACVSDGFVNEHTSALGTSSVGRDVYRSRLPGFLAQFDHLAYEVVDVIVEGERAAARYRTTATYEDRAIDIAGVMLFEIHAGEIVRRTDVWDSLTFLRQTGAG